jgi:hypothetical protein
MQKSESFASLCFFPSFLHHVLQSFYKYKYKSHNFDVIFGKISLEL